MFSLPVVLTIILFLIVLNGLFAAMEIALVSVSRARLRRFEQENRAGASAALHLQKRIDEFFATVQIGITFVATLSSAIGGAVSGELFAPLLDYMGIPSGSFAGNTIALLGITMCVSYVSLIVGELVPKSLARRYPGTLSSTFAPPFLVFSKITAPAVRFLSLSTRVVLKALRIPLDSKALGLTTEEFRMMAWELAESGQMPVKIHDMVVKITRLADTRVEDVMVPRHRIVAVTADSVSDPHLREKILSTYREHPFTVFPVMDVNTGNPLGAAHVKDLLTDDRADFPHLRPLTFTPRGQRLDHVLSLMRHNNTHLSVIVDEHGTIDGLITLEDILEELVGEIESATPFEAGRDIREEQVEQPLADLTVDGLITLHELKITHGISLPESPYYSTLAGFLFEKAERVPSPGDVVPFDRWDFKIVSMDANRITKVRIVTRANSME
jgi:putative hemolysin